MEFHLKISDEVIHDWRPHWTAEQCAAFMKRLAPSLEAHIVRSAVTFLKDKLLYAEEDV